MAFYGRNLSRGSQVPIWRPEMTKEGDPLGSQTPPRARGDGEPDPAASIRVLRGRRGRPRHHIRQNSEMEMVRFKASLDCYL
ncbi:hypothetical protein GWI33_019189 [Rhynchophorus ferrugineus]|uniref:Uncharacterized protein n=1 Tax=Rhynchophorus ferrugineus TaxID=354439 RepID=A0A834HYP7_RHYFE|nr:hypothetical protein GWI33_019189 [Rhynchophorus ferrugineus]